jgi:hypothetical protein
VYSKYLFIDEVPLINSGQLDAGSLLCSITYDKVPSKNLFSCIDPAVIDQNFKFVESHYED